MNNTDISRRTLAKGAAWSVPAVVVAGAAPAMAASPHDEPCPPLTDFGGCGWNFPYHNGSTVTSTEAKAYFDPSATSGQFYTYNISYPDLGEDAPRELNYIFEVTYPDGKGPDFSNLQLGGYAYGWSPEAVASAETTVEAPDGFESTGITWKRRTVTVTYTGVGCCPGQICSGLNLNNWSLTTDVATGSQAMVSATTEVAGACAPTPYSRDSHKWTNSTADQTALPYNADIDDSSNRPIWN